jgi:type IV pilus assembly protein PilB
VSKKVGNTFADFIRSFLRQDPDIIMVGEIRDIETAEMAFRAAQTGHLVLSTLHTNNAIDSISRLLSLNVEPHQLISSLLGVLSQRLIRRICPHCAIPDTPPAELINRFFEEVPENIQWVKGKGCPGCNYTGYKGRMAVGELWVIGARERSLIGKKMTIENIRQASDGNFITMMDDIYSKISNGETTLEEIVRAIPPQNMYKYGKLVNSNKA